jgi:hypothetical protein
MAAGLNATLSLAQMNQDYGSDIATIRNALRRLKTRYDTHWLRTGAADYVAAGGTTQDRDTLGSAITEAVNLYAVWTGTATVGSDGTVTTGTTGHNFDDFMGRVAGDSVA